MRQKADWRVVFAACTLAMQITTDAAGTTRINNLDCFVFTLFRKQHHSIKEVIIFRHPPLGDGSQYDADVPNLCPYCAREVRAIQLPMGEKLLFALNIVQTKK